MINTRNFRTTLTGLIGLVFVCILSYSGADAEVITAVNTATTAVLAYLARDAT